MASSADLFNPRETDGQRRDDNLSGPCRVIPRTPRQKTMSLAAKLFVGELSGILRRSAHGDGTLSFVARLTAAEPHPSSFDSLRWNLVLRRLTHGGGTSSFATSSLDSWRQHILCYPTTCGVDGLLLGWSETASYVSCFSFWVFSTHVDIIIWFLVMLY